MNLQPPLEGLVDYRLSDRTRIVQSLADFRREWQQTVDGKKLLDVEAPVGLIFADIADRLGLTAQERYAFLGGKLINEVNAFLDQRVSLNRPI